MHDKTLLTAACLMISPLVWAAPSLEEAFPYEHPHTNSGGDTIYVTTDYPGANEPGRWEYHTAQTDEGGTLTERDKPNLWYTPSSRNGPLPGGMIMFRYKAVYESVNGVDRQIGVDLQIVNPSGEYHKDFKPSAGERGIYMTGCRAVPDEKTCYDFVFSRQDTVTGTHLKYCEGPTRLWNHSTGVWETDWLTGPEDQVVDIVSEEGRKSFNFISMGFNYEGVIKDEMAPLPEFSELVAWNHYEEIDEIPPEDEVDFSAGKDYMDSDRFP